jgi:hypothetical protein
VHKNAVKHKLVPVACHGVQRRGSKRQRHRQS